MSNRCNKWVLVETTEQVELAQEWVRAQSRPYAFLTNAPAPYYQLTRQGAKVTGLHEFTSESRYNELAWKNIRECEAVAEKLGQVAERLLPGLPEGFEPFQATLFHLKMAADSASFNLRNLLDFFTEARPESVAFWASPHRRGPSSDHRAQDYVYSLLFEPQETVAATLLQQEGWESELESLNMPQRHSEVGTDRRVARTGARSRLLGSFNPNLVRGVAFLRRVGALSKALGGRGSKRLLVTSIDAQIQAFIHHALGRSSVGLDWWTDWDRSPVSAPPLRRIRLPASADRACLLPGEMAPAAMAAIDGLAPWLIDGKRAAQQVLKRRLEYFITHRLTYLAGLYVRACAYFQERQPAAVLAGTATSDSTHTFAQAAAFHDIPFVVFQHGGCYGYCEQPHLSHSDLKSANIMASYGPGVASDLEEQARESGLSVKFANLGWPSAPVATNNAGRVLHESESGTILYVTTNFVGNLRYGPYHSLDDTRYFLRQVDVVKALAEMRTARVIVKVHYKTHADNPLPQYVADSGYDNVRVLQHGQMVDLLPTADVVVIDYASTTLLEALAAARPVVLLDIGVHRLRKDVRAMLTEEVCLVETKGDWRESLKNAVTTCLARGTRSASNTRFLQLYGNPEYQPEALWSALERAGSLAQGAK